MKILSVVSWVLVIAFTGLMVYCLWFVGFVAYNEGSKKSNNNQPEINIRDKCWEEVGDRPTDPHPEGYIVKCKVDGCSHIFSVRVYGSKKVYRGIWKVVANGKVYYSFVTPFNDYSVDMIRIQHLLGVTFVNQVDIIESTVITEYEIDEANDKIRKNLEEYEKLDRLYVEKFQNCIKQKGGKLDRLEK